MCKSVFKAPWFKAENRTPISGKMGFHEDYLAGNERYVREEFISRPFSEVKMRPVIGRRLLTWFEVCSYIEPFLLSMQ